MNAAEFISLAREMLQERPAPSRSRSIISRSYYGAFHVASDLIAKLGLTVGHNHGHLQHDYLNAGSNLARDLGLLLQELHSLRVQADYRLNSQHVERSEIAQQAVTDAERIAEWADNLRDDFRANPGAKQAFVTAITEFRRKVNRRV